MKRTVVFVLLAAMLFLCGCQPTPEVEYVPNKGDNVAEDKINATALPTASPNVNESDETSDPAVIDTSSPWDEATGQAVFPERWEDDIKTEAKEIVIAADVITPETDSYPVQLVRKSSYTSEDLFKVANYLFRDVVEWRKGTSPSKEYLAEAMQFVSDSEMKDSEKQEQLDYLTSDFAGTSITDEDNTPCTSIEDIPVDGAGVTVFMANGGGSMSIMNGDIFAGTNLYGIVQPKKWFELDPDAPEFSSEISIEEAVAHAEDFFSAMELDGFELYSSDEARCVNMYSTAVYDTGWDLRFVRSYGYAPFSVSADDASQSGPFQFDSKKFVTEYTSPLKEELIGLYVTEDGIKSVSMYNSYEYIATVNENVQLMDFGTLTMRIKMLLSAAINNPIQTEGYFKLEKMTLTAIPQQKKDSSDYYYMPVWVCTFGDYYSTDGPFMAHYYTPGEQIKNGPDFTLAFNAIDGTRVSLPQE